MLLYFCYLIYCIYFSLCKSMSCVSLGVCVWTLIHRGTITLTYRSIMSHLNNWVVELILYMTVWVEVAGALIPHTLKRIYSGIRPIWHKERLLVLLSSSLLSPSFCSLSFVLTKATLPTHLLSSLGNSTLVCRTLVSKNESIWRIIFTCNEPECHHARKPNYECLVLWQPNKYFTL